MTNLTGITLKGKRARIRSILRPTLSDYGVISWHDGKWCGFEHSKSIHSIDSIIFLPDELESVLTSAEKSLESEGWERKTQRT